MIQPPRLEDGAQLPSQWVSEWESLLAGGVGLLSWDPPEKESSPA